MKIKFFFFSLLLLVSLFARFGVAMEESTEQIEAISVAVSALTLTPPVPDVVVNVEDVPVPLPERSRLFAAITQVLESIVCYNECFVPYGEGVSLFDSTRPSGISIKDYVERTNRYGRMSRVCFILALIYVDRLLGSHAIPCLNRYNFHRLWFVAMIIAAKFFDDHYYDNKYYARVAGLSLEELNSLELEFLFLIKFHLFVSLKTFNCYVQKLVERAEKLHID